MLLVGQCIFQGHGGDGDDVVRDALSCSRGARQGPLDKHTQLSADDFIMKGIWVPLARPCDPPRLCKADDLHREDSFLLIARLSTYTYTNTSVCISYPEPHLRDV